MKDKTYYHGTNKIFSEFDENKKGTISTIFGTEEVERYGIFFTEDLEFAKEFGQRIIEVSLNLKKTLDLRNGFSPEDISVLNNVLNESWMEKLIPINAWEILDGEEGKYFVEKLKEKGFDSVLIKEESEFGVAESFVVLNKNLITIKNKPKISRKLKK